MNEEMPKPPEESLEARLTALLLGELTAEKAAALRELIAKDAMLARLHDRLKRAIDLVREAAATATEPATAQPAPLRLSDARRQKLLAHFKTVAPKQFTKLRRREWSWVVELGAVAAILILLAAVMIPNFTRSRGNSQANSVFYNLRILERARDQRALENKMSPTKPPAPSGNRPSPGQALPNDLSTLSLPPTDESKREVASVEVRQAGGTPRQEIVLPSSSEPAGTMVTESAKGTLEHDSGSGGGIGGGGGGFGGGGGLGPVADAGAGSYTRIMMGNPDRVRVPNAPAPTSGGSSNRFISLYPFAMRAPGAEGEVAGRGSPTANPAEPSQPTDNVEAKFAEGSQKDHKALDVGWYDSEAQRRGFIGQQEGAAPSFAGQPATPKPGIFDPNSGIPLSPDKQNAVSFETTNSGRAMLEKSVETSVAGAASTMAPILTGITPSGRALVTNRLEGSDQLSKKRDETYDHYADQVPLLSAVPKAGRLFGANPDASDGEGQARLKVESPSIVLPTTGSDVGGKSFSANGRELPAPILGIDGQGDHQANQPSKAKKEQLVERLGRFPTNEVRNRPTETEAETAQTPALVQEDKRLDEWDKLDAATAKLREAARREPSNATAFYYRTLSEEQKALRTAEEDHAAPRPPAPAAEPQPEVLTRDNAFSTFSLNVSDVSFKLAAASLEKGVLPEPGTVRSEEFINAFDYHDPEAPAGVPIAFAWERASYPFAHHRDLLRFSVKTAAAGRQPGRPLNLVLLLDNSGSMERSDRVRIIHEALRLLAAQLQPQDKFSVVTFARTARLWVEGVPGNQAGQVAQEVSGLTPQGGTNLEEAMNLAYQTALRQYLAHGVNRVVLLTDGAANLGNIDPDTLKQKVEAHRKQGIALDCFGIGWEGYNDDLLEILSRNGDGRYGFINTPEEADTDFAGQLAGALRVAASDVKVQVEFNPARVSAYRQIGYAKHQLTKEQFRDNTVDAAEIGAAESGNALYVTETNPRGEGPLAIVRVRYKVPGTADYHEHEWVVPYTGSAASLEQASPAMRLAGTASAFSEWLVSSPYAAEVTPDQLLSSLRGVPEIYGADARPKKLEWMIRQAKSISGR